MNDYSELKKLAEAASHGPWIASGLDSGDFSVCQIDRPWEEIAVARAVYPEHVSPLKEEDAKFIAAIDPTVVLTMLEEIEALKKEADLFRGLVSGVESGRFMVADKSPACTAYLEDRAAIEFAMSK